MNLRDFEVQEMVSEMKSAQRVYFDTFDKLLKFFFDVTLDDWDALSEQCDAVQFQGFVANSLHDFDHQFKFMNEQEDLSREWHTMYEMLITDLYTAIEEELTIPVLIIFWGQAKQERGGKG